MPDASSRISTYPNLDFLVIVNPNSGPGLPGTPSPDHNYAREVPRLNAAPNVVTVGYVKIDYCHRPLSEVCAEVDTYASWASQDPPGLGLGGIMVDETPNHYSDERADYLDALGRYVKSSSGILDDRLVSVAAANHPCLHPVSMSTTAQKKKKTRTKEEYPTCFVPQRGEGLRF